MSRKLLPEHDDDDDDDIAKLMNQQNLEQSIEHTERWLAQLYERRKELQLQIERAEAKLANCKLKLAKNYSLIN